VSGFGNYRITLIQTALGVVARMNVDIRDYGASGVTAVLPHKA
jgi:hypothetical protein